MIRSNLATRYGGAIKSNMHLQLQWCRSCKHTLDEIPFYPFIRSNEIVSWYCKQVLFAIVDLRWEMIKAPAGETLLKIRDSPRWYLYFKMNSHNYYFMASHDYIDLKHKCVFMSLHGVSGSQVTTFRGRKHSLARMRLLVLILIPSSYIS
jgi:hypothetical protein